MGRLEFKSFRVVVNIYCSGLALNKQNLLEGTAQEQNDINKFCGVPI